MALLVVGSLSALSVTRTITPTGDDVTTFIRNSNGGYWSVTASNLQTAINEGVKVTIPSNVTITLSSDLALDNNTLLVGGGKTTIFQCNNASIKGTDVSNITLKDFRILGTKGILIQGDCYNITVENIIATNNNSDIASPFNFYAGDNDNIENLKIINCEAVDCDNYGFLLTGGTNSIIKDVMIRDCIAKNCGRYYQYNDWIVGFDLAESVDYIENMTVIGCKADRNWETGFYFDGSAVKHNVVISNCISTENGIDKGAPTYGSGFLVNGNVTLTNSIASGNALHSVRSSNLDEYCIINNVKGFNYNSLFPYYNQSTVPTLIPESTAYWYNSTGGWLYQVCNANGTQYYLNMSTTY